MPAPQNRYLYRQDLDVYTPILKSVQSLISASSLSRPYLCVSSLSMLRFAPPHYRFAVNARPPEIPPHFVRCCFAVRFRFAPLRMTRADVVEVVRSEARTEQNRGEKAVSFGRRLFDEEIYFEILLSCHRKVTFIW